MDSVRSRLLLVVSMLVGCAQPTLLSCPTDLAPCADGCLDLTGDPANCGACGHTCATGMSCALGACVLEVTGACELDNGGCSLDAMCFDMNGTAFCACHPEFHGDGHTCAACTVCDPSQFVAAPCNPNADTVCLACSPNCATCAGNSDVCTSCPPGSQLIGSSCQSTCGNGIIDPTEMCDDGNFTDNDGCSAICTVEPGAYCFGSPSACRAGSCAFDPATALPLGGAFGLDGAGTASAMGITFSQRSTIFTTADLNYPLMIEADIVYGAPDVTFIGARGSGLRQAADADEPTDSLRARLSAASVDIATGGQTLASTPTTFVPATGVPYHILWFDDGVTAMVSWTDLAVPSNTVSFAAGSTYHGGGDRAFVGGGDMAGLTVANVRVCSAPALPVTSGLVARYSAIPSWTAVVDGTGPSLVNTWHDLTSGNHTLNEGGPNPTFVPGLLNGHAALDFGGSARLVTSPFALTTDVTVFAVIKHTVPAQFGAIAHHGNRDTDWSMEQSGDANPGVMHWQTNNDNVNMDLTLAQDSTYVLTGRFAGNARYFSAAGFDGLPPTEVSIVDASHTITAGSKVLTVGTSDNGEASNVFLGDLLYFDRALDDAERDLVIDYLRRLWR